MAWTTDAAPAEIFALEGGGTRKLTNHNDALLARLQLAETRDFEARSPDGTDVHGLLTLPVGYVAGSKHPLILYIHGGPDGQDAHAFTPWRQLFAARGYAVLNVNYRGSHGRGKEYQQAIFDDWGHKEVVDLLASVDESVKQGIADPDRLGVRRMELRRHPHRLHHRHHHSLPRRDQRGPAWAALSASMESISMSPSMTTSWGRRGRIPDTYIKLGYPLLHADRIKTPTLFMGGDQDLNVPLNGGQQMYRHCAASMCLRN